MPYYVEKREGKKPWKIIKEDTGEVVGSSSSEEKAKASVRARYAEDDMFDGGEKQRKRKGKS